jgi:hypothetical protein
VARHFQVPDTRAERTRDRDRRDQRALQTLTEKDDLKQLLSSEIGRRIAARVLREATVGQSVFSQNAMVMSANAGKQELGLWFADALRDADKDNYLKMQAENDA